MKIPQIVIGGETEYGIFIDGKRKTKNGRQFSCGSAIEKMLDCCSEIFPSLHEGVRGSIENHEEHRRVEERASVRRRRAHPLLDMLLRSNVSRDALGQRRGYSGLMLPNGARFYRDMGHPEYSTPETSDPREVLVAQRAGDLIAEESRRMVEEKLLDKRKTRIVVDRTNSDGKGNSYAAHENYSLSPEMFWRIVGGKSGQRRGFSFQKEDKLPGSIIMLFFAARQIITGSGKFCAEDGNFLPFQISQRADFICSPYSIDTTANRGIINLRDTPYADFEKIRRLHVIVGDSNMSEVSLFLKFGITALFLMMLDTGFLERVGNEVLVPLEDPVKAYREVSWDLTLKKELSFKDGSMRTPLEVLYLFLGHACSFVEEFHLTPVWHEVLRLWEGALEGLSGERSKHEITRSLDWVAKERFATALQKSGKEGPFRWIDLAYHSIDPEDGIFYRLEERGEIERITSEEEVLYAREHPPSSTRAWMRGEVIRRYFKKIDTLRWNEIYFSRGAIFLRNPLSATEAETKDLFEGDPDFAEFISRLENLDSEDISWSPSARPLRIFK